MVTCSISGTCHHETNLAWLTRSTIFVSKITSINRVRHDSLEVKTPTAEHHILWFVPHTTIFR